MPTILCQGKDALLEITLQCNVNCPHCYRREGVSSHANHVDLSLLKTRIDWICENSDATCITLLGGEPLLHPDFPEIVDYIHSKGKSAWVITTASLSNHLQHKEDFEVNLAFLIEKWRQGNIGMDLSLQPGLTDTDYLTMINVLKSIVDERRANRKAAGTYQEGELEIYSTIVIGRHFANDKEGLFKLLQWINDIRNPDYPFEETFWEENFPSLALAFSKDWDNSKFVWWNLPASAVKTLLQIEFRYFPETICQVRHVRFPTGDIFRTTTINMAKTQPCQAMASKFDLTANTVTVKGLMIRADGEVTLTTPRCIPVKSGFCNTEIHTTPETVLEAFKIALSEIRFLNIMTKRHWAKNPGEFCQVDRDFPSIEGEQPACSGCRTDTACTACGAIRRNWINIMLAS